MAECSECAHQCPKGARCSLVYPPENREKCQFFRHKALVPDSFVSFKEQASGE